MHSPSFAIRSLQKHFCNSHFFTNSVNKLITFNSRLILHFTDSLRLFCNIFSSPDDFPYFLVYIFVDISGFRASRRCGEGSGCQYRPLGYGTLLPHLSAPLEPSIVSLTWILARSKPPMIQSLYVKAFATTVSHGRLLRYRTLPNTI